MAIQISGVTLGNISGGPSSITLEDLADVYVTSPVTGQFLRYNSALGLIGGWQNASINPEVYAYLKSKMSGSTGIGITYTDGTSSISIANSGVTSLVAGTNISVSGSTGAVTVSVTGSVPSATAATNLAGGIAGNIAYQSSADTTAFVTNGAGVLQAATSGANPVWTTTPTLTGTNFTGIPNNALTNKKITIGSTAIDLGDTVDSLAGLTSVSATTFTGALSGNASTATKLATARSISTSGDATWTVSFDGSADQSAALTLATVNSNVGTYASVTVNSKGLVTAAANLSGDVTTSGSVATLATVNNTPQTDAFRKMTVNGKGLVTATSAVGASDITTALGYTPVNNAGDTMTGLLILSGDPVVDLGAATKQYVDNIASGLNIHPACRAATTANLSATYNNGTAGVGATLTGTGALPTIDGVTLDATDRVLVKNQTNQIQNGIYVVTTLSPNWVLTRATDFDNSPSGEVQAGDATYVQEGSQAGSQWVETTTGTITIGSSSIVFSQFGGPGVYSAGAGISIASNVISNTGVLSNIAGTGISVSGSAGNVTITNSGVTSLVAGSNISVSSATGAVTVGITGTVPSATTATNIAGGAAGNVVYQTNVGTSGFVTNGAGVLQAAISGANPAWTTAPTLTGTNFSSIPNAALTNSSVTVGTTSIALGASSTTLAGLTSVTSTSFTGSLVGNADTATTATNATNVATTNDITTNGTKYVAWLDGTSGNNPVKTSSSKFTFNPSTGQVTATTFAGDLSGNASTATSATTSTNLASGVAGNVPYQTGAGTTGYVSNAAGVLQASTSGATPAWTTTPTLTGTNFSGIPNNALSNSSITIGSTNIALGGTTSSLAALTTLEATTSVTTPLVTNAGTLALSATGANVITFNTDAAERMRISATGNVGIGSTPSAWANGFLALQIYGSSLYSNGANRVALATNVAAGVDSGGAGGTYSTSNPAAKYEQVIGTHRWDTAASGTANDPITFTTRMFLDNTGNLGIGTTSPATPLHISKDGVQLGSTTAYTIARAQETSANVRGTFLGYDTSGQIGVVAAATNTTSSQLAFWTYNSGGSEWAERMRITATGNVGIGTSSPTHKLDVSGTANVSSTLSAANVSIGSNAFVNTDTLTTTTTAANQVVTTLSATTYRSVKFLVQVTSGSSYQVSEITLIHDGTTVYMTEYGNVNTGSSLAAFDADISSGNIRLLVTPVNASTVIKTALTAIVA